MNTKRAITHILLFFLSLTIINEKRLVAQSGTSAAISGNVTDATGTALVDAAVSATDVDTRAVRAGKSNAEGRFLFSQLSPGRYTVTISLPGFAEQISKPVAVDVGRMVTLNFQLTVSAIAQTVEVTANQALLSLENPNTTTTLESNTIARLPNPGQDLTYIVQFSPGALMNTAGSSNDAKAAGG